MTHAQMVDSITSWAIHHDLPTVIVADHGSLSRAYTWHNDRVAIVFSGHVFPKADDVLARFVGQTNHSVIVTADTDLQARCRRACQQSNSYQMVDPAQFLQQLEKTTLVYTSSTSSSTNTTEEREQPPHQHQRFLVPQGDLSNNNNNNNSKFISLKDQAQMKRLEDEIRLRAQMMNVQVQLGQSHRRTTVTNKRQKKLKTQLDRLQKQLIQLGPSVLNQVTTSWEEGNTIILERWNQMQHSSSSSQRRKEETGDRIVLAEQLRRQIEEQIPSSSSSLSSSSLSPQQSAIQRFVNQFNQQYDTTATIIPSTTTRTLVSSSSLSSNDNAPPQEQEVIFIGTTSTQELLMDSTKNPLLSLEQISIVAISDTHGFERQFLTNDDDNDDLGSISDILPRGDILLHLGDFTGDDNNNESEGWKAFDEWLWKQPHPIKIVVRGNHDPWHYSFDKSGAWYITEPTTIAITANLTMGVIPYGSSRKWKASQGIPTQCDVLATHVPPLHTLDRTFTGKAAGSGFLNQVVNSMGSGAPRLWLCGHIHEARGVAHCAFGGKKASTMVINAANANRGRAMQLDHGAIVVRVHQDPLSPIEIARMDDKSIFNKLKGQHMLPQSTGADTNGSLLMAIDLGLKSGVALFGRNGKLLRYEQFHFQKDSLDKTVKSLLTTWEQEARDHGHSCDGDIDNNPPRVTHLVLEGADSFMLRAWMDATNCDKNTVSILRVSPEEWRAELLQEKERLSASNAKAASRLIARQIVNDFGIMPRHEGKFTTDVAEAVCLGFYVCYKMGWVDRGGGTAVRRYSNGNIVVPR